jgi:hypothetical protein
MLSTTPPEPAKQNAMAPQCQPGSAAPKRKGSLPEPGRTTPATKRPKSSGQLCRACEDLNLAGAIHRALDGDVSTGFVDVLIAKVGPRLRKPPTNDCPQCRFLWDIRIREDELHCPQRLDGSDEIRLLGLLSYSPAINMLSLAGSRHFRHVRDDLRRCKGNGSLFMVVMPCGVDMMEDINVHKIRDRGSRHGCTVVCSLDPCPRSLRQDGSQNASNRPPFSAGFVTAKKPTASAALLPARKCRI